MNYTRWKPSCQPHPLGGKEYYVWWKDYSPNADLWEPATYVDAPELIKAYEAAEAVAPPAKKKRKQS